MVVTRSTAKNSHLPISILHQHRRKTSSTLSSTRKKGKNPRLTHPRNPRTAKCLTSPDRPLRTTEQLERWRKFDNDSRVLLFDHLVVRCARCKMDVVLSHNSDYDWRHWEKHLGWCLTGTSGSKPITATPRTIEVKKAFKKKVEAMEREHEEASRVRLTSYCTYFFN
ncbi:hypothetical protein C8Q76DRAFT_337855 [Earliella scabrosa]|nr:hypothetical protein C8Q76DRAFT_337855 [Earliella scabrosa]